MNKPLLQLLALKFSVVLLLVIQVIVTTVPYCCLILGSELELVEFNNMEDFDNEEEKDKKEKEKNNLHVLSILSQHDALLKNKYLTIFRLSSIKHLEQPSPPPEFS